MNVFMKASQKEAIAKINQSLKLLLKMKLLI